MDCQIVDIQTPGNITLNAAMNPRQKFRLTGADVLVTENISQVKMLEIEAQKLQLNSNIVAGHASINARYVSIAKDKKLIAPIAVIRAQHLHNEGAVKSKLACNIAVKTMHNKGNISAGLLYTDVSEQLVNEGKLFGAHGFEIKGKEIHNKDRIQSNSHVKLQVQHYKSDDSAHLVAKNLLTVLADTLEAKGEFKAKVIAVQSQNLILHTQLQARKLAIDAGHLALHNVNLDLPERTDAEMQDEMVAGAHTLIVRDGMVVAKGASLQLNQTVTDIQGDAEIKGELYADHSELLIKNIQVDGKCNVDHSVMNIANSTVNREGAFSAAHSQWQGGAIASQGVLNVKSCELRCNGIAVTEGDATFQFSKVALTHNLDAQNQSRSVFESCEVNVNQLNLHGNAKVSDSALYNDSFSVAGIQSYDHVMLQTKAAMSFAKNSDVTIQKQSRFAAGENVQLDGVLAINGESLLKANQLKLTGQFNLDNSGIAVKQDVFVEQDAKFCMQNTAQLHAKVIHSHGQINVDKSFVGADGLNQQAGQISLKQSVNKLNKGLKQQKGASLELDGSSLGAPMLMTAGTVTVKNKSGILGSRAQLNGEVAIDESEIKFEEQFIVGEEGKLKGSKAKLDLNLCQWRGSVELDSSVLKAKHSAGKGAMKFQKSRIAIDQEFRTFRASTLNLNHTELQSEQAVFTGEVFAEQARIESDLYQQTAQASYNHSLIQAKNGIDVSEDAAFKFSHGKIESGGDMVVGCDAEISHSDVKTKGYWQEAGKLQVSGSKINTTNTMHFEESTNAQLNSVELLAGAIHVSGGIEAQASQLTTGSASFYHTVAFNNSVLKNAGKLLTAEKSKLTLSLKSLLNSKDAEMQGEINIAGESMLDIINQLDLRVKSHMEVQSKSAVKAASLVSYGDATFDQSLLEVHDLELANTLIVRNGSAANIEHLDSQYASKLSLAQSSYEGDSAKVAGNIECEKSGMQFTSDMTTIENSNVNLKNATLTAQNLKHRGKLNAEGEAAIIVAENIETKTTSEISGDDLKIKGREFEHYGNIRGVKKLTVDVDNFNIYGTVDGNTLEITADNSLLNKGVITGDSIKLDGNLITNNGVVKAEKKFDSTSLAFVNIAGGTIYAPNTTINTGLYANVGGIVVAHNLTKNTVVDLNFGMELPGLPSSWDDVCSPTKLFNVAKTAVSAVSAPIGSAMGIANSLYHLPGQIQDVIKQGKSLHGGGWDKFRFRQALPAIMSVKNVAVSVGNNAQGLYKLG
ncbi:MAG: hypothetical protein M3R00_07235, partial [Pseudomonadota bacterium]|nr:hypothetical protein [Pseudomonadota bacterium]